MKNLNDRAIEELKELKKYAKEQKAHWEQCKKERTELNLKNIAEVRALQCQAFVFKINECVAKLKNENSVLPIPDVIGSNIKTTCSNCGRDSVGNCPTCG